MKTYGLRKGTLVKLADGREAELCDSARRLARRVRTEGSKLELVCSFDIRAYKSDDGIWNYDLDYSDEEVMQRKRRELARAP